MSEFKPGETLLRIVDTTLRFMIGCTKKHNRAKPYWIFIRSTNQTLTGILTWTMARHLSDSATPPSQTKAIKRISKSQTTTETLIGLRLWTLTFGESLDRLNFTTRQMKMGVTTPKIAEQVPCKIKKHLLNKSETS